MLTLITLIFVVAYAAIALEHPLNINKSASALVGAGLLWVVYALGSDNPQQVGFELNTSLVGMAQIVFFLMGMGTLLGWKKTSTEALRRALRQDPDVVLVGEMRDLATIEAAISAANAPSGASAQNPANAAALMVRSIKPSQACGGFLAQRQKNAMGCCRLKTASISRTPPIRPMRSTS